MFEKQSFKTLLQLCNQETMSMLFKKDALSRQLRDVFLFHQDLLQGQPLAEAPAVLYTLLVMLPKDSVQPDTLQSTVPFQYTLLLLTNYKR